MTALLVFSATLLIAVLISELADRSVLSTAVVFLVAGFLVGEGTLGLVVLEPDDPVVSTFAELALFSVLFTDGMKIGLRDLAKAWNLPGRALLLGLPLTLLGTALLAHWIVGLPWAESFLLGAVLSPTDPVFASAIVGREEVPLRLRHLLNIESGLNDGLALPIVIVLLAYAGKSEVHLLHELREVGLGIVVGVLVPWAAIRLERSRLFAAHTTYAPLNAFAIGLLVLSISSLLHANAFLAAFSAGITVATIGPEVRHAFHQFGELVAELLKLAALLVFGALMSPRFLGEITANGYLFAFLAVVAVRPVALALSLLWSPLDWRERTVAGWFGPKGFASVVFSLLILRRAQMAEIDWGRADQLFHLAFVCIAGSIIAHSSTDVVIARWFRKAEGDAPPGPEALLPEVPPPPA